MNKRQKKKQSSKLFNHIKKALKGSGRSKEFLVLNFSQTSAKIFNQEHADIDMTKVYENKDMMLAIAEDVKIKYPHLNKQLTKQ